MKCYNVARFNGSVQDCVMKSHLDYESAKKITEYLNGINKKPEIRYRIVKYIVPMTREELFGDVMPGLKTQRLRGSSFETYFQI